MFSLSKELCVFCTELALLVGRFGHLFDDSVRGAAARCVFMMRLQPLRVEVRHSVDAAQAGAQQLLSQCY